MSSTTIQPDIVSTVPPVLTLALVHLAPFIAGLKSLLQLFSWSASTWYNSWLALAAWWAVCLFLRPLLPTLLALSYLYFQHRHTTHRDSLTTEHHLQAVITDLTAVQSLLQSIHLSSIALPSLLRATFLIHAAYLFLLCFVSFRTILALAGTVLFTWRAPWAVVIRATIWRSAWFRWSAYRLWAFLSGQSLPPPVYSAQLSPQAEESSVQTLRFLFTIYENQRWWMGLDWTAALLPGERPSWCTSCQSPIPPPNAFTLPENTTIYLSDGKNGRIKRTAVWRWEEPEWRVLVHKDGGTLSRVERPLPSIKEEAPNSSRLMKAAGRLREAGGSVSALSAVNNDSAKNTTANTDTDINAEDPKNNPDGEPLTDPDGWIYGDNKWENQSSKGGMGKYTRYRRWTRIAVVFETVESVESGDTGIVRDAGTSTTDTSSDPPQDQVGVLSTDTSIPPDSPLRQRLRSVLKQGST